MNHKIDRIKDSLLKYLGDSGYSFLENPDSSNLSDDSTPLAFDANELLLAIKRLNPHITDPHLKQAAIEKLQQLRGLPMLEANRSLHEMLRNGVRCFHGDKGTEVGENIKIFDGQNFKNNHLSFCCDFGDKGVLGPYDVLLLVNGIPLVIIRMTSDDPQEQDIALKEILHHYKDSPQLLYQNSMIIVTNGIDVAIGAQFTQKDKLIVWRGDDGQKGNDKAAMTLLQPKVLLDFITNFISFSSAPHQLGGLSNHSNGSKILATYYQYYAVNHLIQAVTKQPSLKPKIDHKKLGIIGHTYGSRINHAIAFYIGKLIRELYKDNPTIVCVLENIDVEDRFLQFMIENYYLFGSNPVRAESAGRLKELINLSGGGIIIASVQKFYSDSQETNKVLSDKDNIFVILKGLNVCNYGARPPYVPKTKNKNPPAKKIKNKSFGEKFLPNARIAGFINITNAPMDDQVYTSCGDYASRYSIGAALRDGVISNTYYVKRLTHLHANFASKGSTKRKSSNTKQMGKDLGKTLSDPKSMKLISKDIVTHFEESHSIYAGNAIVAVTNRKTAVALYDQIVALRPKWESPDLGKGDIKILMTNDVNDPPSWAKHRTTQEDRKVLRLRYRNPNDPLKIVIVRDMWLAEFREESMHTIYWVKFLQGHGLIQALSMGNAMGSTKSKGLILDYIGIENYLKAENEDYINKEEKSMVIIDAKEGLRTMKNKMAKINKELNSIDYSSYIKGSKQAKHALIRTTRDYIFDKDMLPRKIIKMIDEVAEIYDTLLFKEEMAEYEPGLLFLYSLRACLLNLEPKLFDDDKASNPRLIDDTITETDSDHLYGIKDIHNPEYVKLDQKIFNHIMSIKNHKVRDRALSCLIHKLVEKTISRDVLLGKRFLDKLRDCSIDYNTKLTPSKTKKYRESLNSLAADIIEHGRLMQKLGVNEDVYSIYNMLTEFQDADKVLANKKLIKLSEDILKKALVRRVQDWSILEHTRAGVRKNFKHSMREHGYATASETELANLLLLQTIKMTVDSDN